MGDIILKGKKFVAGLLTLVLVASAPGGPAYLAFAAGLPGEKPVAAPITTSIAGQAPAALPVLPVAAVSATAPAPIQTAVGYEAHRLALSAVAGLTGEVHSLRPAGEELTQRRISEAAGALGVISDVDDTLVEFDGSPAPRFSADMIDAVEKLHAAGKTLDVISDRPDSVLETIESLPLKDRAGMYVAVDVGGRIYRIDNRGNPRLVHQARPMSDEVKGDIETARAAAAPRLPAAVHETVWRPYTLTIRFSPSTKWEQVRESGEILQAELIKQGSPLVAKAKMAKMPGDYPYVVVSINTKAAAARFIAERRGLEGKDVVLLGDGAYAPKAAQRPGVLTRFGARVSGRALPEQGNANDAAMALPLPQARFFSVGGTGDPRRRNLVVLGQTGLSASRRVLLSLASKPVDPTAVYGRLPLTWFDHTLLWLHSLKHYFIDVNVENWREYKKAHAESDSVRAGNSPIKDPRGFFVDSRMMGMVGGARTVGSRSGSDAYVAKEALGVFDQHFDQAKLPPETLPSFLAFLNRAVAYNPRRSSSNLRKHIRKGIHGASFLLPDRMIAYFDQLMGPDKNDAAESFQRNDAARVLQAFHQAVSETIADEPRSNPSRVVGVVILGSFATESATPASDFDLHVLTLDGRSSRVTKFLSVLEKRWSSDPESKNHPINGADFGFPPSRELLLKIHHDRYLVMSDNQLVEHILGPPPERYKDRSRPDQATPVERMEWKGYNALLRGATLLDDAHEAAAGPAVDSLSKDAQRKGLIGWLIGRSLYLAGFVFSGAIAYPLLAQELVGKQGYTDLMSLGAVAGILLAPLSGIIAQRLSFRNTAALNNAVRIGLALTIPTLVLTHTATFWPLLAIAVLTSWNVASTLVAEDKLLPALAGSDPKRLSVLNAAANMNFIGINVLLGIFLGAGHWVDSLSASLGTTTGLAATFIASAALSAVASVVQWKTIPHVRLSSAQSSASSVNTSTRERAGLIWTASLGIGTAGYLVLHAIAPQFAALALVAAALVGLVMTSDSLHRLWKNPTLRAGSLLSMTYAFVMFPISGILIPFAAKDLNGGAQLQGQLQGSLFFGQLLAGSTMLKLPGRWNTGVRIGVLGALGAWLGFYLFPANLALAAGGAAVATALYAVSSVLTDRGWMRYAFVGLSALALPLFFWGNIPALLLGVLIVGLVNVPNKITIDTVVQSEAKADSANTGSLLGARSALNGIAAAFGYASFGAIFAAFHPALPAALSPILGMFAGIGALLFAASFWLASKLSKKDFAWPGKSAAAPVAREYSVDEIAQSLADRIRSGGIRAIVTDYDGTLEDKTPDDKAVPASAELTGLLGRLRERGVAVAVSTNHFFTGDHNGMTHLLGDRMTEKDRAGMMFVVQSGARVYQYDAAGATPAEPAWKEVSFDDAERARIQPVFEAAAAKLGLSPDDYKIFHEDSRSLIEIRNRKGDEETRLAEEMYALLNQANKENGFGYLVQLKPMPTMRFVPYVQYFKAHKGTGARKAVEMLKANGSIDDESQVVIFGDDFKPEGNDLYMAQALPRALAVSVGKNSDPSQPNVMQAAVRGAATTREILARLNELLSATPQ